MKKSSFPPLKQYDFIILRQGQKEFDGGLILEIDRRQGVIRYLSPKKEDLITLTFQPGTNRWRFSNQDFPDQPADGFTLTREEYAKSYF